MAKQKLQPSLTTERQTRLFTLTLDEDTEKRMNQKIIKKSMELGKMISFSKYVRDLILKDCEK